MSNKKIKIHISSENLAFIESLYESGFDFNGALNCILDEGRIRIMESNAKMKSTDQRDAGDIEFPAGKYYI